MEDHVQYRGKWISLESVDGGPPPVVGEDVYVGTSWYLSHGVDDFHGGLCAVESVKVDMSAGKPTWFVSVRERPGYGYNWAILREEQEKLREQFGTTRGYPDPDDSPSSNEW